MEDLLKYNTAAWSDVLRMSFNPKGYDSTGVSASTALSNYHNPNGLGHGGNIDEVLLTSAAGGELCVMERDQEEGDFELELRQRIQMESMIDNSSFYADEFASPGRNASGYILAGVVEGGEVRGGDTG